MKKVLSLILVIAMVLSSMSFAFAGTFEDVTGDYENAVNALAALGVISGYEDGTFRPERTISRAELAKLLVEALGYGKLVAGATNTFSDTQGHWASGYVTIAAGTGLVIGYPNGTFLPDKTVTYDEAYTMVIRALGYTDDVLKGIWPTNFKVKAIDLGLDKGVAMKTADADRGGVAQILYNSLEKDIVEKDRDGILAPSGKLLIDNLATREKNYIVGVNTLNPDHKNYGGSYVNLAPYIYQSLDVYVSADDADVVVYIRDFNTLVLEGTVTANTNIEITVEDADEDTYTFDADALAKVLFNGEQVDFDELGVNELVDAKVTLVLDAKADEDLDEDDQEVVGVLAKLATMTVQAEDEFADDEVEILADPSDVVLPVKDKKVDYKKLVVTGDAESLEDIEENDVLTLYYALGAPANNVKLEIVVSKNTVEGKVTRITYDSSDNVSKVYVDGTAYEVNSDSAETFAVKDEGTFYLDFEGKIYAAVTESDIEPENYALVLSKTNGVKIGGVTVSAPKVKVLTAAGEEVTYEIKLATGNENTDIVASAPDAQGVIAVALEEGDLIVYNLNKDGKIDDADLIDGVLLVNVTDMKTTVNSFNVANNVVIFSVPDYTDTDDAEVITIDKLGKEITGYIVRNTETSEIEAIIVIEGAGVQEKVYGLVTSNSAKVYDEDEDETVYLYTTYVDGVKVEYLGVVDGAKIASLNTIAEFTLSNGKLDSIDTVLTDVTTGSGIAADARVTTSINGTYFLADDVVVYVLKADGKFDKVGTKSDIRGKNFIVYDTVDDDGDYDIVVVWPVAE